MIDCFNSSFASLAINSIFAICPVEMPAIVAIIARVSICSVLSILTERSTVFCFNAASWFSLARFEITGFIFKTNKAFENVDRFRLANWFLTIQNSTSSRLLNFISFRGIGKLCFAAIWCRWCPSMMVKLLLASSRITITGLMIPFCKTSSSSCLNSLSVKGWIRFLNSSSIIKSFASTVVGAFSDCCCWGCNSSINEIPASSSLAFFNLWGFA